MPNLPQGVMKLDHLEFPSPQSNPAFDAAVLRVQYALRDRMVQIQSILKEVDAPLALNIQQRQLLAILSLAPKSVSLMLLASATCRQVDDVGEDLRVMANMSLVENLEGIAWSITENGRVVSHGGATCP